MIENESADINDNSVNTNETDLATKEIDESVREAFIRASVARNLTEFRQSKLDDKISYEKLYSIIDLSVAEREIVNTDIFDDKVIVFRKNIYRDMIGKSLARLEVISYGWNDGSSEILFDIDIGITYKNNTSVLTRLIEGKIVIYDRITGNILIGSIPEKRITYRNNITKFQDYNRFRGKMTMENLRASPGLNFMLLTGLGDSSILVDLKNKSYVYSTINIFSRFDTTLPRQDWSLSYKYIYPLEKISVLYPKKYFTYTKELIPIEILSNSLGVVTEKTIINGLSDIEINNDYFFGFLNNRLLYDRIAFLNGTESGIYIGFLDVESKVAEKYFLPDSAIFTVENLALNEAIHTDDMYKYLENYIQISEDGKIIAYRSSNDGIITVYLLNKSESKVLSVFRVYSVENGQ